MADGMTKDDAGAPLGPPASPSPRLPGDDDGARRPVRPRPRHGPWRVAVAESSMEPALEPGDWLLVDPTVARWPRRGTIVVFHEPGSGLLVVKRVAARPGDAVATGSGPRRLGPDEAWLMGDAPGSHDSRHYGPVSVDRLVGRAWFRYGPPRRVGRLR
jgi:hypothetical protein